MALSLKDAEADHLARQVASLTGETVTETVRKALAERLARERLKQGKSAHVMPAIDAIVRRFNALPVLDARPDDQILGYDEMGLPS